MFKGIVASEMLSPSSDAVTQVNSAVPLNTFPQAVSLPRRHLKGLKSLSIWQPPEIPNIYEFLGLGHFGYLKKKCPKKYLDKRISGKYQ